MFGRRWQSAEGTLVDIRVSRFGPGDKTAMVRHYLMDVRPSSGEPFRTEVREPLMTSGSFNGPTVIGAVVHLECDPGRKQARFSGDRDEQLADDVAALQAEGERLDAEERAEDAGHTADKGE
jgi:hypothetical protein